MQLKNLFPVRGCQYGIISALERFFNWYGRLVATYAKTAIIICVVATVCGGLGLLRFYEEGDAASLVVPKHSQFRKNIDWIDENFPREVRVRFLERFLLNCGVAGSCPQYCLHC